MVLGVERLWPATADSVRDWSDGGVDGDAGWAGGVAGFDVEVSEAVVDESGQGGVELAAVAPVPDTEPCRYLIDSVYSPLVVVVVIEMVE